MLTVRHPVERPCSTPRTTDLLMGGGRKFYLPESENGTREDGVNLEQLAQTKFGYHVVNALSEFETLPADANACVTVCTASGHRFSP